MIVSDQMIKIKWNPNNRKYYEDLGYTFTSCKDYIYVPAEDVSPKSHVRVPVECDYCHKIIYMTKTNYTRSAEGRDKVACKDCKTSKTRETMERTYGEAVPMRIDEFKQKVIATNIDKYGCENPMQTKGVRDKVVATLLERYGVDSPVKLPQHAEAMKNYDKEAAHKAYVNTCMEKYGVDNAAKLPDVIAKAKATCVDRYGGESSQCSKEIRQKSWNSMVINGTTPISKPEQAMVDMLIDIYGKDNCYPQYVLGRISMDCMLEINGVKIDVEYDGKYWHDRNKDRDRRRNYYCINRGFKVLRFNGDIYPPTQEQIKYGVDYLVNSEHTLLAIDI